MDEIINDVRTQRETYAAEFGYDIWSLYADAKSGEAKRKQRVISLEPKVVRRQEGTAAAGKPLQ